MFMTMCCESLLLIIQMPSQDTWGFTRMNGCRIQISYLALLLIYMCIYLFGFVLFTVAFYNLREGIVSHVRSG